MTRLWFLGLPPWLFVSFATAGEIFDAAISHRHEWWSFPLFMTTAMTLVPLATLGCLWLIGRATKST